MDEVIIKNKNSILLLSVKQLQKKQFVIGNYQRGYKWGKKEILELLNDIYEYDSNSGLYCLQPIILKPLETSKKEIITVDKKEHSVFTENEVIDGQQRTTTLFLLLSYLQYLGAIDSQYNYTITFNTRIRSGQFLENKLKFLFDTDVSGITEDDLINKDYNQIASINTLWADFIKNHKEFDNIDVYHFFLVSCYIKRWILHFLTDQSKAQEYISKLLDHVKIIWYSLDSAIQNNKVIDVFLNNNKGKIKLTTSELIKALFILKIKNTQIKELAELHTNSFALEWDSIEKKLQDDSLWYFIQPNENLYKDGTRIDYLFDLILKKDHKQDELFAYRYYESAFNSEESDFDNEWNKVVQLFNKLIDWYNNSELYHYIGFFINANIQNLLAIIESAKGKNKLEIKDELKNKIIVHFTKTSKNENGLVFNIYDVNILNFKKYYYETKKVLLLHNIMYYVKTMSNHKFPFELYNKENWSIEHIVAQNPKEITDFELYKEWFTEQAEYQNDTIDDKHESIIENLNKIKSFEELDLDNDLKEKIKELIESFEDRTHLINNLLLLDRNTNSSLQNEGFEKKRKKILFFDRNGQTDKNKAVFIPVETLNAFNKTFSTEVQYKHWTLTDGENYKNAIFERLQEFLPKITANTIEINEEE
jgi:uncharacterized protein with ParB-like and HNH nuclease domain